MLETFLMTFLGSMTAALVILWVGVIALKVVTNKVVDAIIKLGEKTNVTN